MAKEALHEHILRIAFAADLDRPAQLSSEDVFWKLEDPDLTRPQVKECLEWLTHRGDLTFDLGKYGLSRVKFFELKEEFRKSTTVAVPLESPVNVPTSGAPQQATKAKQASLTKKVRPAAKAPLEAPGSGTNLQASTMPGTESPATILPQALPSSEPASSTIPFDRDSEGQIAKRYLMQSISPQNERAIKVLLLLQVVFLSVGCVLMIFGEIQHLPIFQMLTVAAMGSNTLCIFLLYRVLTNRQLNLTPAKDLP